MKELQIIFIQVICCICSSVLKPLFPIFFIDKKYATVANALEIINPVLPDVFVGGMIRLLNTGSYPENSQIICQHAFQPGSFISFNCHFKEFEIKPLESVQTEPRGYQTLTV
jgi:hypothetical protein